MEINDEINMIASMVNEDLAVELMYSAMKSLKENPKLSIYEALYEAQLEWDL